VDDHSWFLEQVGLEQARLRASIRALGVRSEVVDDLAQDTLVIALGKLGEFDREGGNFGAWVRQIARRLVANERRKETRRNKIVSDHLTDLLIEAHGDPETHEVILLKDEEVSALRVCLGELPRSSIALIRQRYFEDLSPGEIGSRMGCPSNQIRQTLLRLRRGLMVCIERRLNPGSGANRT